MNPEQFWFVRGYRNAAPEACLCGCSRIVDFMTLRGEQYTS